MDEHEHEHVHVAGQLKLASNVIISDCFDKNNIKRVAGLDISYVKDTDKAVVAGVILEYPSLKVLHTVCLETTITGDYMPGFLGLREMPAHRIIWSHIEMWKPDIVLIDGNGILHPRKCGSACYFGLEFNIPTIGVAKNMHQLDGLTKSKLPEVLIGTSGTKYGYSYIAKGCTNPIYVSPGHMITAETALELVSAMCIRREPEPLRLADRLGREYIRTTLNQPHQ